MLRSVTEPNCPADFTHCPGTGRCLRLLAYKTDQAAAASACAALDAHLTVPRSEAHMSCLRPHTAGGDWLWLGVTDHDQDKVFEGVDGGGAAPRDPGWWGPGELNGHSGAPEPCAFLAGFGWGDVSCAHVGIMPACEADAWYLGQ